MRTHLVAYLNLRHPGWLEDLPSGIPSQAVESMLVLLLNEEGLTPNARHPHGQSPIILGLSPVSDS